MKSGETLPLCEANGEWQMASGETPEQLVALKCRSPKPRHAVASILDWKMF